MTTWKISPLRRAVLPLLAFIAAGAVLAGTAATSQAITVPPVSGGSELQRVALQSILARLVSSAPAADSIVSAEIGSLPEGFDPLAERAGAAWIYLTISDGDLLHRSLGLWQALLVAGAFRSESDARQLPDVVGRTITILRPDGSQRDGGSAMIWVPPGAPVPSTSEATLTERAQQEAAKAGVSLVSVQFARTLELAPVVTVVATDPTRFVGNRREKLFQIIQSFQDVRAPAADGAFLLVRDLDGQILMFTSYAVRAGQGVGWVESALAS